MLLRDLSGYVQSASRGAWVKITSAERGTAYGIHRTLVSDRIAVISADPSDVRISFAVIKYPSLMADRLQVWLLFELQAKKKRGFRICILMWLHWLYGSGVFAFVHRS